MLRALKTHYQFTCEFFTCTIQAAVNISYRPVIIIMKLWIPNSVGRVWLFSSHTLWYRSILIQGRNNCWLVICDIDDMNIHRDISACDMIWYKIIYYWYKLRLRHFSHVISKMTVFVLVFNFLKMSGHIVKNQNCAYLLLHYDLHVSNVCDVISWYIFISWIWGAVICDIKSFRDTHHYCWLCHITEHMAEK